MKTAIELAEESLNRVDPDFSEDEPYWRGSEDEIERLVELIREDEREKAMQVCRYYLKLQYLPSIGSDDRTSYHDGVEATAENIEAAIRARGNT